MNEHCKPEDDCFCSEKTEKLIHKLFYTVYCDHFQEVSGEMVEGKIILHFHNPSTDQHISASLDEDRELEVVIHSK